METSARPHVGPYVLLERLGAGGMGEVYLGRDTRLDRKVALKCLLAHGREDEQYARIIHEARAAAQINHHNVATIHDVIEEGTRAYIVMEYVDGESLAARLRRGRVPMAEVLSIGRQLLAALAAAHAVNIVHRDLKPANIQLTRTGVVKVLDFGIARATRAVIGGDTTETGIQPSAVQEARGAGTPAYMSPEQMIGAPVDERADLYSLGAVLFELATGRRPYEQVDLLELARMPESLAPRADLIDPAVPTALADVLAIALKCDRDRRYQSAKDFDDALAHVQRKTTIARPTRREWLVIAGAALAGLVGIAVRWRLADTPAATGPRMIRAIAVLPFLNVSGDPNQEYFVDGMTDGLINALGRISAVRVTARTSVMGFKATKKSVGEIARELKVDAIVEGSAQLIANATELVRVTVNVIDPATQTQLFSTALEREMTGVLQIHAELARTIAQRIHVSITEEEQSRITASSAQSVDPETFKLYLLGRREWAGRTEPELRRALTYFTQAAARGQDYAPAYAGLADTYALLTGDFAAFPHAEGAAQAIANASRALALDPGLAEAYTSLAFANFFLQWDFRAAGQQFRKALALNPSYATAHHWYGNYLSDMGNEQEALNAIRRALTLDPLSPIISRDVAWPLFFGRRYAAAIAQLDTTLRTFPEYAPAERLRARALALNGDHAEALRQFERQKSRSDGPRPRCELAWAMAVAGRRADALAELESARAMNARIYQYDVALVYAALNDTRRALDALEQAYREHDPTMVNVRHDPRLDSLRSDPRYQQLVVNMRFPQL